MNQPNKLKILNQWEQTWETAMGAWFPGERVLFRGKELLQELNQLSWMELILFGITGRQFQPNQIKLFEAIWVISTSFPEPRLWNNRIATLAGTSRSTVNLGVSAGIAASEAIIFGHRPLLATIDFLKKTQQRLANGEVLTNLIKEALNAQTRGRPGSGLNREVAKVPGFGRPITTNDERLQPLLTTAQNLGFTNGIHVLLAQRIEDALQQQGHNLYMNVATLMGALCADQDLSPREYYHYVSLCFTGGLLPCAIDAQSKPEGAFFPLRCDRIKYQGPKKRQWKTNKSKPSDVDKTEITT